MSDRILCMLTPKCGEDTATDILNNSPENPTVSYLPELEPLAAGDGQGVNIVVDDRPFVIRSLAYKSDDVYPRFVLGVWDSYNYPVGYLEAELRYTALYKDTALGPQINPIGEVDKKTINRFYLIVDAFVRRKYDDGDGIELERNDPMGAYINAPNRGIELGQTVHSIMLALLQNFGYSTFAVECDFTNDPEDYYSDKHRSFVSRGFRYRHDVSDPKLTYDYSIYGRYVEWIKGNDPEKVVEYSTALSTYQLNLIQKAFNNPIPT